MKINHTHQKAEGGGNSSPAKPFEGLDVLIAIPNRDNRCYIDLAACLAVEVSMLTDLGATISIRKSVSSTYPDAARNMIVAYLLEHKEHDILIMIDDDMWWPRGTLINMIYQNKDIIGGAGNLKTEKEERFAVTPSQPIQPEEPCLIKADYIGGALMVYKRGVFELMAKHYPGLKCDAFGKEHGYSFFHAEHRRLDWMTEDYIFCELWRKLGKEIWCYTDIDFQHLGHKEYTGNYLKSNLNKTHDNPDQKYSEMTQNAERKLIKA